ncbi:unnamed protein product [Fraxinus pennsylvanica]|uniref:Uncharacterized protein n=1 Tax=Fraxinus pennsylvanica TaxID=56036 RepID=A0AAD2A0H0_9LAMI|nr:unnamed protein product [Fraxinus pennsylvanica]
MMMPKQLKLRLANEDNLMTYRNREKQIRVASESSGGKRFMSARSDLSVLFGAQLKLCSCTSSSVFCMQQYLCCALQQSRHLFIPAVSMRLRLKRTCSGVECFGGFHINRLSTFFFFFKCPLT